MCIAIDNRDRVTFQITSAVAGLVTLISLIALITLRRQLNQASIISLSCGCSAAGSLALFAMALTSRQKESHDPSPPPSPPSSSPDAELFFTPKATLPRSVALAAMSPKLRGWHRTALKPSLEAVQLFACNLMHLLKAKVPGYSIDGAELSKTESFAQLQRGLKGAFKRLEQAFAQEAFAEDEELQQAALNVLFRPFEKLADADLDGWVIKTARFAGQVTPSAVYARFEGEITTALEPFATLDSYQGIQEATLYVARLLSHPVASYFNKTRGFTDDLAGRFAAAKENESDTLAKIKFFNLNCKSTVARPLNL